MAQTTVYGLAIIFNVVRPSSKTEADDTERPPIRLFGTKNYYMTCYIIWDCMMWNQAKVSSRKKGGAKVRCSLDLSTIVQEMWLIHVPEYICKMQHVSILYLEW